MRQQTAPGGWHTPAPGAVGPFSEDEEITKPDNSVNPELIKLVRLIDSMPVVERRRFVALAGHYVNCPLGERVLIEEVARSLARKKEA